MAESRPQDVKLEGVIISYPSLFEKQEYGGKEKYRCTFVIVSEVTLKALKKAAAFVAKEKWSDKAAKMKQSGKLKWPFKESTEENIGYPEGSTFIRVTSDNKPGVVSRIPDADGKPTRIEDPNAVYAGCIVNATVTAGWYDVDGSKGVTFYLNNVQLVGDGPRLDSRTNAADEFDADEDAVADLSDMDTPAEDGDDIGEGEDLSDLMD